MIYIKYGPPDERDQHNGGTEQRASEEGGGTTSMYPYEQWRYRYIEGLPPNVEIEFVDTDHDRRVPHDHGSVRKGRADVCSRRRAYDVRADGPMLRQDAPLQPDRRHAFGNAAGHRCLSP